MKRGAPGVDGGRLTPSNESLHLALKRKDLFAASEFSTAEDASDGAPFLGADRWPRVRDSLAHGYHSVIIRRPIRETR